MRKVFEKFDSLHDGEISLEEFSAALQAHYSYSDEEVLRLFQSIDVDGEGTLQYSEFLAATLEAHGSIDEERLAEAFDRIDSDDSGYITVRNLQALLGEGISKRYLESIIDEADITRDHRISYDEFLAMWDVQDDAKLNDIKAWVRSKRVRRDSHVDGSSGSISLPPHSSVSSIDTTSEDSTTGKPLTGSMVFGRQKQKSIRCADV